MHAERRPQHTDELIAELASRQAGVVSRAQLVSLGIGRGAIGHRIATARLHSIAGHRGVLAVGHTARGRRTALWAAHLALGPESATSHRSATALWELRQSPARVEMTVARGRRPRTALLVHRTNWLPTSHVTEIEGLPVTTVERTLFDLGAVVPIRQVERAFDQADVLRLIDHGAIDRILKEGAGRPGAAALRAVAGRESTGSTLTQSDLEERLLAIVRRARLPEPRLQHVVLGYRADFCWPADRLIVEADGAAAHATRRTHARDTRRDVRLTNAGWTVLRFSYTDVVGDSAYVAASIRIALARGRRSA